METVGKVIKKVFPQCYSEIKKASRAVDHLVETKQYSKLEKLFGFAFIETKGFHCV